MSSHVKSHSTPRGKRGRAWDARRIFVLIAAIAAIVAASWLAPDLSRPPPGSQASQPRGAPPGPPPDLPTVEATADIAAPTPSARANRRRRSGVPLDGSSDVESDGYEILSADELAGISQARD